MVISKTAAAIYAAEVGAIVGAGALAAVPVNYEGIALILGAAGVLITTIGTFIVSMVTLARQGVIVANVQKIETATNSMKDALVLATREKSLLEGAAAGRAEEETRQAMKAQGAAEKK